MSMSGTWQRARQARRMRSGCPAWRSIPEACIIMLCGVTVRTAVPVALVVGTLLSVVNQGAVIAGGGATVAVWLRVLVNYLVPFAVSSMGFLGAGRIGADRARAIDSPISGQDHSGTG